MLLDELDLSIIEELKADARQPVRSIAHTLGLKRSTVRYRLNRLISEGILRIICRSEPKLLGYQFAIVLCMRTRADRITAVADRLASLPTIKHISLSAGRYNIIAWAVYRDESDLANFISKDLADISDISSIEIMQSFHRFKAYFQFEEETFSNNVPSQLSELDLALIREMERDPRQTITDLAKTLGCSHTAARNNLTKLIDNGIIRLFPIIDPIVVGFKGAVILIKPELDKVNTVASKFSSLDTTMHVSLITGQWQIIVAVQFQDSTDLYNYISETISSISGIIEFEVLPLLKTLKFSLAINTF